MKSSDDSVRYNSRWARAFGLGLLTLAFFLLLGSYHPEDPSSSTYSSTWQTPRNVLGYLGSWLADAFFQLFGHGAWLVPGLLLVALLRWIRKEDREEPILGVRWWAGLAILLSATALTADLLTVLKPDRAFPPQGLYGIALGRILKPFCGPVGSYLLVVILMWSFCLAWWDSLPRHMLTGLAWAMNALGAVKPDWKLPKITMPKWRSKTTEASEPKITAEETPSKKISLTPEELEGDEDEGDDESEGLASTDAREPAIRRDEQRAAKAAQRARRAESTGRKGPWELPPLSLLEAPKRRVKPLTEEQLREIARKIGGALRSFEIEGEITEISPGPIITMYEFQPAPGVRAQKIMSATTDLAMTLGVSSVRIVAPIPGKSVAGIEVPNPDKEEIVLRDVYESTIERAKSMKLPLALGKDGEGKPVVEDLSRMPHLLIGGATSMGKSVLVNSILTGLLCRFSPDELRLIIVDPKLVEFKAFEDIPHLMLPIVNDPADASQALKWAVGETKRRYLLMQKIAAKNIEAYNQKVAAFDHSTLKDGEEPPTSFAYIVIIVDELAELMLTGKKDVEQSIVRLSQLARAAGIHLIMSTQRPSADVVTGLIKSNCPSRIALRVASASDSRIILDCAGSEQLIGKGDMFFTNTGPMGLRRMQGPYVSDGEIDKICEFWRDQGEPEYKDEILAPETDEPEAKGSLEGTDELYAEVVDFAKDKGKISTSLIQRRFQIGYTRAARIMEQLEARGIVGEAGAAGKPRDVVI